MARYALSGVRALDKKTALLMACLHRDPASGDWAMRIVSLPSANLVLTSSANLAHTHATLVRLYAYTQ